MKRHLPNILTLSRILVIPLLAASFYLPAPTSYWVATSLFLYASVTDFFDGYLARRWKVESALGRFLDPIADKLLVATVLVYLLANGQAHVVAVLIILLRELLVSGLREHLMEKQTPMPVSMLAKYKTAMQMVALTLLLIGPVFPLLYQAGVYALWLAVALTVMTGYDYLKTGLAHVK